MIRPQKIEAYMKTVYLLQQEGRVRAVQLSRALQVSNPTVSVSLRQLEEAGYLTVTRPQGICLTPQGTAIAEAALSRVRVLRSLLKSLGVEPETAAADAEHMGAAISDASLQALTRLAEQCAAGRPAPAATE